jgi:hypothetical protein
MYYNAGVVDVNVLVGLGPGLCDSQGEVEILPEL